MAKGIKNKPVVNQKLTQKALIKDYVNEIESLKNQLFVSYSKKSVILNGVVLFSYKLLLLVQGCSNKGRILCTSRTMEYHA